MYVCDFYQTLSVKGGYKGNSLVYITYTEEEMVCQKYYCPSYFYTRVIIFDNLLKIKKILSL
jgi:hypothetical protein